MESTTILFNAMIVTMDQHSTVFQTGAVVFQSDIISAIGQSDVILRQFPGGTHVDLHGHILLPGLVNTHVHTSQQLGRGIADDVDLMTWLHRRIWPYESNMNLHDSYISTLLCGIELIHSGSQKELYEKHHGTADGRIRIWLGIRQIMNSTDRLLLQTRDLARELKTGIHMHIAEIQHGNQVVVDTRKVEHGTVTFLEEMKFLKGNLLAAHTVWVNDDEIGYLSKAGVKVSHCPAAAMRMFGFAPVRKMIQAGVCVSIGTDGAPSNNRMSMVDEMYLASLINKGCEVFASGTTDPTALPAEVVLRMATIDGAKTCCGTMKLDHLRLGRRLI